MRANFPRPTAERRAQQGTKRSPYQSCTHAQGIGPLLTGPVLFDLKALVVGECGTTTNRTRPRRTLCSARRRGNCELTEPGETVVKHDVTVASP